MSADRACFDQVADLYAESRPGYPDEVVTLLCERAKLAEGSAILEIGPGTGQLSVPLAARGHKLHALELGPQLAARASAALAEHAHASVEVADFEAWDFDEWVAAGSAPAQRLGRGFDLVVCAQAFHWLNPAEALPRAARALVPGGRIALVWTLDRSQDTPFYKDTSPVYQRYGVGAGQPPLAQRAAQSEQALSDSPEFGLVHSASHLWERTFSRAEWLRQVRTFSSTLALSPDDRDDFLHDLEIVLDKYQTTTRRYETVIHLATRS